MDFTRDEILMEYKGYITNLPSGLKKIIDNIENEKIEIINKQLSLFVEGMQWMLSASKYLESQEINTNQNLEVLNEHLETLLEGMKKQDYILLSDIIEYELIPYFENLAVKN